MPDIAKDVKWICTNCFISQRNKVGDEVHVEKIPAGKAHGEELFIYEFYCDSYAKENNITETKTILGDKESTNARSSKR